ncbi:MAG: LutC/YkgG family protein [Thermomicrobiales bacterium]
MIGTENVTHIPEDIEDRLTGFTSRVDALGVPVLRVPGSAELAEWLRDEAAGKGLAGIAMSSELRDQAPELVARLAELGVGVAVPESAIDAQDAALGVNIARMAIVETGSTLLAEDSLAARAIGLLAHTNVVVCRTGDLRPSLVDAAALLKEMALRPGGSYGSLVTGPSRTADIEMSLTVGVQGPAKLLVVFVDDLR